MQGSTKLSGCLAACHMRPPRPSLIWRLRNRLRPKFLTGWLAAWLARLFSKLTGIPTLVGQLEARLIANDGRIVDYGLLSHWVVTDAGVAFLVDDWDDDTTDITTMNYHASGTGTASEAAGDTALGAEATTITDRATGTKTQPAANQLQSQATQSYTGTGAITEHGLFSTSTEGAGTLWDRSVFSEINVANGDSIQWTYTCTVNSGG